MDFSHRVEKRRKSLGVTEKEVAKRLGVPESAYRNWEAGQARPDSDLRSLARALGLSIEQVMTEHQGVRPGLKTRLSG